MSELKVVKFEKNNQSDQFKQEMLDTLDEVRRLIETGGITEFVMSSVDYNGDVIVHQCVRDLVGGVGLFELGKNLFIIENS
jgi:hypothetical protein